MTFRTFIVLVFSLLTISACVLEPYGRGYGERGERDRGDRSERFQHNQGQPDYGRPVWRG